MRPMCFADKAFASDGRLTHCWLSDHHICLSKVCLNIFAAALTEAHCFGRHRQIASAVGATSGDLVQQGNQDIRRWLTSWLKHCAMFVIRHKVTCLVGCHLNNLARHPGIGITIAATLLGNELPLSSTRKTHTTSITSIQQRSC